MVSPYPVQFDVDFPSRPLNRLTTAFRFVVAIPIIVVLTMLSGETFNDSDRSMTRSLVIGGAAVFVPLVLMLVFRQKYPRWWFDWNLNLLRFSNRVTAYVTLLDDRYPSTDEEQSVHLDFAYPDTRSMNRWLPLVKWLLAIPHYFVLVFLAIAVAFGWLVGFFAVLITGRWPEGLRDFIVGFHRWAYRVQAYVYLLTDVYPPFRLAP